MSALECSFDYVLVIRDQGSCRDLVMLEATELEPMQVAAVAHHIHPESQEATLHTFHTVVQSESAKVVQPASGGMSALAQLMAADAKKGHWILPGQPPPAIEQDAKSTSSASSTSTSKGSSAATVKVAPPEFPWHLSVQAAFQIAKIPAPPLERLLPVGFNPPPLSPTVKHLARSPGNSPYESPESPMSRMDMITIGNLNSPVVPKYHCSLVKDVFCFQVRQ